MSEGALSEAGIDAGGPGLVPRTRMDTHELPAVDAEALWMERIGVMFDARLRDRTGPGVHAQVDACMLDGIAIGQSRMGPQCFDRSASKIARDGLDHYLLQFYVAGHCGQRMGRHTPHTQPGDLWITDLSRPLATEITAATNLNLVVPRTLLAPLLQQPDGHHQRIVRGQTPMARLLLAHLTTLMQSASDLTLREAARLRPVSVGLAAAVLNGGLTDEVLQAVDTALKTRIRQHVAAHLASDLLGAERVAAVFGISVRKLYYLFEPDGGFAAFLTRCRLRRSWELLRDSRSSHMPISAIAHACGFSHPESFSRAFRRAYGLTARTVRALVSQGESMAAATSDWQSTHWGDWIARLR